MCFFFWGEENPLPPAKNVTAEVRFVSFVIFWLLMLLLGLERHFELPSPLTKFGTFWHFGKLSFCQRVVKRWYQTQPVHHPALRIGCFTSRLVNLSPVMVAAVIWNCYTTEVGGIIILPRTGFLNLSVSIILGFASPKKSGRMCRLPLAHYTKQWNCLFLLCLLGFFTQSSPSHDAVLWFHFVGRLSYPIRKKPVEMTEVRMERCFAMPALAMVEVLHTLNGPPGYFSKWIPMDSSEFAWGLQPWSGMGTVPGGALGEIFDV